MTPRLILGSVIGLIVVVLLLAATVQITTCTVERRFKDRPPEVIEPEDIEEGLVHEPPSVLERIIIRELQPVRSGTAPEAVAAEVDSFVAAAQDSTVPPKYPPVRGEWADDRLTLAVGKSDGSLVRNEYECPSPCKFFTQDTLMGAQTTRAIPRLLPGVLKDAAICLGFGGAAAGVAVLADYNDPLLVGVAGTGACAVAKVVF